MTKTAGFRDDVAPPKGDRWGPGSRIPALILSPLAKKRFVDHTLYDTTSILLLITRRFSLPMLPAWRAAMRRSPPMVALPLGDLTNGLNLTRP